MILNTKTLHKPAIEELVSCAHQQAVLVSEGKRQKENQERATATAAAAAAAERGGNPQPPANSASYSQTRQKYAKVITPPQTSSPSLPPSLE